MRKPATTIGGVRPDLSRLSRAERREIVRLCNGAALGNWRLWALTAALCVLAVAATTAAGTVFRIGGVATGFIAACAGGLLFGGVVGRFVDRLARPHLAAELHRRGRCPRCAYDLRATPGGCPECGEVVAPRVST